MHPLLVRAAAFAAAFAIWLALVAGQMHATSLGTRWIAANYHEKERALQSAEEPRVLLVGGSSVIFGLRADDMTAALGVPVVNFGNHAGLGLDYNVYRADRWIRRGDTVVLALEYELFDGDMWGGLLADYVVADDPDYFFGQPWLRILRTVLWIDSERLMKGYDLEGLLVPRSRIAVYYAPHLDGYGDTLGNLPALKSEQSRKAMVDSQRISAGTDSENLAVLAKYIRAWQERGARVVAIAPPLIDRPAYHEPRNAAAFARFPRFYKGVGVPMPLEPAMTMYPAENFFDSRYHLDTPGAHMHTARVIEAIRPFVPEHERATRWRPADRIHALAGMQERYSGWEPLGGFTGPDGSDWSRPPAFQATPGRARMIARTVATGPARLRAIATSEGADDILHIEIAEKPAWRCRASANERAVFDVPLGPVAQGTPVAIDHGATLDFEELKLSWRSGDEPASAACERESAAPR